VEVGKDCRQTVEWSMHNQSVHLP